MNKFLGIKKDFDLTETQTRHSEGVNVSEESMMCHCDKSTVSEAIAELYGRGYRLRQEVAEQPTWQSKENKILDCFTFVRNDKKCKCAFTLAETLIVLVILGVVAAITVPALVNRHMEAERRTKLKKAMTVYDTALNKMVIENGIKSDTALTNWADSNTKNDCANTSVYFKVARNLEVNENATNCKFRAADGVFWDISDIKKPLVALREQDLNAETAQSDTNRAFYMFGWFDENGSLRANDLGKIDATNKAALEKLYDFINGKTKTSMSEVAKCDYFCQMQKTTNDCPVDCKENNTCSNCKLCSNDNRNCDYYNSEAKRIGYFTKHDLIHPTYYTTSECTINENGKTCIEYNDCESSINECDLIYISERDNENNIIKSTEKHGCKINDINNCKTVIKNHEDGSITNCDGNEENCIHGIEKDHVNLNDYGLGGIPFSTSEFENVFIELGSDENNYTAYAGYMRTAFSPYKTTVVEEGNFTNFIQVKNGQPVKAGEYNPDEGTTWEADMSTGKVTFYQGCTGYKIECKSSQTGNISDYFGQ